MIFFSNFQQKVKNILKKIENGNANESSIADLCEMLNDHPNMVPEAIGTLNVILQKGNMKAYNQAIFAFNKMAENYIGLEHFSVDIIVTSSIARKNDIRENGILNILGALSKIAQKYPERMKIAVPELLLCLENPNVQCREISYFVLCIIAATHHEFFNGHSKELIRVMNGLNKDERIYSVKLTKKLAKNDKEIAAATYDLIEDMRLNHPDSILRSEAGYAMDVIRETLSGKPKLEVHPALSAEKQGNYQPRGKVDLSENLFSGLSELMAPDKEDLADLLEGMNLQHLIVGKV